MYQTKYNFEAQVLEALDMTPRNVREVSSRIRQNRTASRVRGTFRTLRVLETLVQMEADGRAIARRAENQELRFART